MAPQLGGLEQTGVRRHHLAGLDLDDVSRHQLSRVHFPRPPLAYDPCPRHFEGEERLHRAMSLEFGHEADPDVQHQDGEDGARIQEVPVNKGACRGNQEQSNHDAAELAQQNGPRGVWPGHPEDVRSESREARGYLFFRQAQRA